MTLTSDDIAEQQADLVRLLLPYLHVPLPDGQQIHGVLPSPAPRASVRVVTGPPAGQGPSQQTAWEIPLQMTERTDETVGPDVFLGLLRALHTGTQIFSTSRTSTLMGMTLIDVNPHEVELLPASQPDNALTVLRTLIDPWTEEQPDPRLRGYLFRHPDKLRLYLDSEADTSVTAVDVRTSGALTALLAALPTLVDEGRTVPGDEDPHCSSLIDLAGW